jgi:hypothetical protein
MCDEEDQETPLEEMDGHHWYVFAGAEGGQGRATASAF